MLLGKFGDLMFSGIYQGKRVLITGDSGFKGSWLALWLQKLGAELLGLSLYKPSEPDHATLLNLDYQKKVADIRDLSSVELILSEFQPEIVFHLAAESLVRKSYSDPVGTFNANVMGTVNILEAIRSCSSVKAVVVVTSDKCYENRETGKPFVESDPLGGLDPYSVSKGSAELVASCFYNSFLKKCGVLLATVRAGNVIGGGDWGEDRLVPDIMNGAARKESVEIRSPDAVRPWQHVLEPLSGYLLVGRKLLQGEIEAASSWNFGPSNGGHTTVRNLVERLRGSWAEIRCSYPLQDKQPYEATLLSLDCSKANAELSWKPVWDLSRTLEKSTQWYKTFYIEKKIISSFQLDEYICDAQSMGMVWQN